MRAFGACEVHRFLHILFVNTERPVFNQIAGIRDGGVWKSLSDDRNRYPVHFAHDERVKNGIFKIGCFDILRDKVNFPGEILFNDFFDTLFAKGHFPVRGHDVDTERQTGVHHVLTFGPECGA